MEFFKIQQDTLIYKPMTKWPPEVPSNVNYIVIPWFKGSFSVLEFTEYLIQRGKVCNTTYTNIQKNQIKTNKSNPIDFILKHNVFRTTCRLKPKAKYIQCQKNCHYMWNIASWPPENSNRNTWAISRKKTV